MIWLTMAGYLLAMIFVGFLLLSASFRDWLSACPQAVTAIFEQIIKKILHIIPTPQRILRREAEDKPHREDPHPIWSVIAALVLISSPVAWVLTRHNDDAIPQYETLTQDIDPQIYSLLEGEMLAPPPDVAQEVFESRDAEKAYAETYATAIQGGATPEVAKALGSMLKTADRKWNKMNQRYVQRLLLVFKKMKEQGYTMTLLEGYRSPERQSRLAAMGANVTHATGYHSYHQFGLAADCAFLRDGKVVITEKDPWAMQGYRLYGEAAESVGLTWGGRWKMADLGHTEFRIKGILGNAAIAEKLTSEGANATSLEAEITQ